MTRRQTNQDSELRDQLGGDDARDQPDSAPAFRADPFAVVVVARRDGGGAGLRGDELRVGAVLRACPTHPSVKKVPGERQTSSERANGKALAVSELSSPTEIGQRSKGDEWHGPCCPISSLSTRCTGMRDASGRCRPLSRNAGMNPGHSPPDEGSSPSCRDDAQSEMRLMGGK